MNFASPVTLDEAKNANRKTAVLLKSSPQRVAAHQHGHPAKLPTVSGDWFAIEGEPAVYPLAVSVQGVFDSYFKGKPSPLRKPMQAAANQPGAAPTPRRRPRR